MPDSPITRREADLLVAALRENTAENTAAIRGLMDSIRELSARMDAQFVTKEVYEKDAIRRIALIESAGKWAGAVLVGAVLVAILRTAGIG